MCLPFGDVANRRMAQTAKSRRAELGLTQAELARSVNTSVSTITRIERGLLPRAGTLRRVADRLGISLDELTADDPSDVAA
jgi:transcriptional regulator with XRE-family HTH domain